MQHISHSDADILCAMTARIRPLAPITLPWRQPIKSHAGTEHTGNPLQKQFRMHSERRFSLPYS